MTRFRFGGLVHEWEDYLDYEIMTDNRNEYWVLTYSTYCRRWYATQKIAEDDDAIFDEGRAATPQEIAQMLATMPIEQLPASALLGG